VAATVDLWDEVRRDIVGLNVTSPGSAPPGAAASAVNPASLCSLVAAAAHER
jgi:hypothetical protein